MVKKTLLLLATFFVAGCALPVPLQIASWVADGISYATTQKSIYDQGLSMIMEKDCVIWRLVTDGEACSATASDTLVASNFDILAMTADNLQFDMSVDEPVLFPLDTAVTYPPGIELALSLDKIYADDSLALTLNETAAIEEDDIAALANFATASGATNNPDNVDEFALMDDADKITDEETLDFVNFITASKEGAFTTSLTPDTNGPEQEKYYMPLRDVNLRAMPSSGSMVMDVISNKQEVRFLGQKFGWYLVELQDAIIDSRKKGWVDGAYLKLKSDQFSIGIYKS